MSAASRAVAGILVAAGDGVRLNGDASPATLPKALALLAGEPLVVHAARRLLAAGIGELVVVHHPHHAEAFARALAPLDRVRGECEVALVAGGATRSDSVRAGLAALTGAVTLVAVHDAARALQPSDVMRHAIAAVVEDDTVVASAPALALADTVKRRDASGAITTVDRSDLVAVQTPQVVRRAALEAALAAGESVSDDLALIEARLASGALVGRIVLVAGDPRGHKVTYGRDLALLEAIAAAEATDTVAREA
jgi:2-C-methyl-D-erythritol 4-phosphate cytidylyltransferase